MRQKRIDQVQALTSAQRYGSNINVIDIEQETNVLDVDLIDKGASDKNKKKVRQFTKVLVLLILIFAVTWISCSYILATYSLIKYGSTSYLEELSRQITITIVGTFSAYCVKAFLETFASRTITPYLLNKDINIDTISTKNRATRYFSLPLTDFFIMYPFSNKEGCCVSTPAPVSLETSDNHDREPLVEINNRRF